MDAPNDLRADLRRAMLTGLLLAVAGFSAWSIYKGSSLLSIMQEGHIDFLGYFYCAKAHALGLPPTAGPEVALRESGSRSLGWNYQPPSVLLLFRPLTALDVHTAEAVWYAALMASSVLLIGLCGTLVGWPVLGTAVAGAWCAPMLHQAFYLGQPSPMTGALFAGSLLALFTRRWVLAGVLIALSSAIKPLEVLVWLPMALAVDRRAIGVSAAAFVGIGLLCALIQGPGVWWDFVVGLPQTSDHRLLLPRHYMMALAPVMALACRRREF
jgi:hypothetical protein